MTKKEEESKSGIRDREERLDFRQERNVERDGAAVTWDGRLLYRRADATGNALAVTDGRQPSASDGWTLTRRNAIVV